MTTLILDTGLPAPREVAAAVYERTDGIPLHIEELLGALSADARANGLAIKEAAVPETIEDAVLARLSHRTPEAQAVVKAGAIIGRCFTHEVLAGIMDVSPEAIEAPLQELIDNFVLDPPGARNVYDFRHQLLRDAVYRSVPVGDRRRFHARAAEFGAQLEGASEIHSSLHYERAGMGREAYEAALAGAREASRLAARTKSFDLYRRAVEHMPDDLDPAVKAEILESYGVAASSIDDSGLWIEMSRQAATAYRAAGDAGSRDHGHDRCPGRHAPRRPAHLRAPRPRDGAVGRALGLADRDGPVVRRQCPGRRVDPRDAGPPRCQSARRGVVVARDLPRVCARPAETTTG